MPPERVWRPRSVWPLGEIWRTTTFRLSLLYGGLFAVATVALLGMIYVQTAVYLTHRVDRILYEEANAQRGVAEPTLRQRIDSALPLSAGRISVFALFSPDGRRITGNLATMPPGLEPEGRPLEVFSIANFPGGVRLLARRQPSGDVLVVGRDINQLREIRQIIGSALIWSGLLILVAGLICGTAFSVGPLRRLRVLQTASREIAAGNLTRRMPQSLRGDELDMFAGTVNHMLDDMERLMSEVRAATETVAHDLRTPLTHARAQLHRLELGDHDHAPAIRRVTAELDEVLDRFRAILRISEIENRARTAGFATIDLAEVVDRVAELYQPVAEEAGVRLIAKSISGEAVHADIKLMIEAVSNLTDNAIKFTGRGGRVLLLVARGASGPVLIVEDNGPGVPNEERAAVLTRFYRSERDRLVPGSGLGLAIVAAIVRLHRFNLRLENAEPGLRVVVDCAEPHLTH